MNPNEEGWKLTDEREAEFQLNERFSKKFKVYWTVDGSIQMERWATEEEAEQHRNYLRQHVDPNASVVKS